MLELIEILGAVSTCLHLNESKTPYAVLKYREKLFWICMKEKILVSATIYKANKDDFCDSVTWGIKV